MAPIVTTGVLIVEKKNLSHTSCLCWGPCQSFSIVPREIHELCVSSLRQSHAIFTILQGLTPSWSRNFRNAYRPSSCFIEKKKNMPDLSTNTHILELCVSSLHIGHAKCFKFLACHQNRGKATLLQEKQYVRVILAHQAMHNFSVQKKKTCNRFHVEEKVVIPAQDPQHSAVGFFVIFALLGEQSRVPAFHPSQTPWPASLAVDEGPTHQEPLLLLHSSSLGFVPDLCPWIWPLAPVALPSSSGKPAPSKAPAPHDAKAQPHIDCVVPLPSHLC